MTDDKGKDAKIITAPDSDPRWEHVQELGDIPHHLLAEIGHFFSIYKDLEGKTVEVDGFGSREEAVAEVAKDQQVFAEMEDPPGMP
jgi:inorganic pyrophosphatase